MWGAFCYTGCASQQGAILQGGTPSIRAKTLSKLSAWGWWGWEHTGAAAETRRKARQDARTDRQAPFCADVCSILQGPAILGPWCMQQQIRSAQAAWPAQKAHDDARSTPGIGAEGLFGQSLTGKG